MKSPLKAEGLEHPKHPLEKLLQEHCPQGVEFVELGEVVDIQKGEQLNKSLLAKEGKYPVMNGGINPSGYWHAFNTPANTIIISQGGASAGFVNYMESPFWAGAHCYIVGLETDKLVYKFLYYFLKNNQDRMMKAQYGAGIPALAKMDILALKIPLPPLIIQEKIVTILDCFAELSAELSARKKQYTYYLNALLDFGTPTSPKLGRYALLKESFRVEWVALGEVATIQRGASPRPISDPKWFDQNSAIHWVRIADLEGKYLTQTTQRLSQEGIKKSRFVPKGHLIMSMCATLGETAITKVDCCIHDGFVCFYDLSPKVDINFLFYWLNKIKSQWHKLAQSGSQANLNTDLIRGVQIPLPPLALQAKIVEILDQFNALTTDLQQGLPAEIEAREKQYTHYLNTLLDFGVAAGGGLCRIPMSAPT